MGVLGSRTELRWERSLLKSKELEGIVSRGVRDSEVIVTRRARFEGSAWRSLKAVCRVLEAR